MTLDIIAYYERRYKTQAFLAKIEAAARCHEAESALDTAWYRCGFYDLLGYDRRGVTYRTVEGDDYHEENEARFQEASQQVELDKYIYEQGRK